ncbi:MAG: GFA family protein [SAR324 cluster bacterium]|nr:GFA family protein [SAR324 cluster bacterium]
MHEFVTPGGSGLPVHYFSCANCATRIFVRPEFLDGFQLIPLGTFDDSLQFEPKIEIFTNYKVTWIRDNGCLKESFEESAVIERIGAMMENLDQRGQESIFCSPSVQLQFMRIVACDVANSDV